MQASLDRVIKFLKTVTPGPILEPQEETNIEHRSIYGNVEITKLQMWGFYASKHTMIVWIQYCSNRGPQTRGWGIAFKVQNKAYQETVLTTMPQFLLLLCKKYKC